MYTMWPFKTKSSMKESFHDYIHSDFLGVSLVCLFASLGWPQSCCARLNFSKIIVAIDKSLARLRHYLTVVYVWQALGSTLTYHKGGFHLPTNITYQRVIP